MPKNKHEEKKQKAELLWLGTEIQKAQASGFYGKLNIIFEEGRIRRIIKEESIMPPTGD